MKLLFPVPALIIILGLTVYSNALFNDFVWDDKLQIVENVYVHSPIYIPLLFAQSIGSAQKNGDFLGVFYRPLQFSVYAILYILGGGSSAIFHLFQILLHSINAVLLYHLFKHFIRQNFALVLALIFLIHPANEVTVSHIANLPEVLFFFFGLAALLILVNKPFRELHIFRMAGLFLLFSLLSKETGLLFVTICLVYIYFFEKQLLVKTSIIFIFLLTFYAILRINSLGLHFFQMNRSEAFDISLMDRVILIPKLTIFYLKEIFSPSLVPKISSSGMVTPLPLVANFIIITGLLTALFLTIKLVLKSKHFYAALFFLIWFLIGLGMHVQIIPLDVVAAKRWLYFPLAGFLGLIGVIITKFNLKSHYEKYLLIPLFILMIGFFSIQTYQMNYLWQDEELLNTRTISLP